MPVPPAPLALVIAPTRELALQVQRELAWLYADTGAAIVACVGGMDARAERRLLERGRPYRRRHAGPPARPYRTPRTRHVDAAGRRPRRGRRDARSGLPRGPRGHPRGGPRQAGARCCFPRHFAESDRRTRDPLPARGAAHRDGRQGAWPRGYRIPGRPCDGQRTRACHRQHPAALRFAVRHSSSATPATACVISRRCCWNVASPRSRCPAN